MIDRERSDEPQPQPDGELIVIASFPDATEAQLVRNLLDEAGIESVLDGEAMASMAWHFGTAIGGVRLLVHESHADQACEIVDRVLGVADRPDDEDDEDLDDGGEMDALPSREQAISIAWKASIIGLFLCPLGLHVYSLVILLINDCLSRRNEKLDYRAYGALLIDVVVIGIAVAIAIARSLQNG